MAGGTIRSGESGGPGLKGKWDALPPKQKQMYVAVGGMVGLVVVAGIMVGGSPDNTRAGDKAREKIENALLPEDGGRTLGLSGVATELRDTRDESRELSNKVERLEQMLERMVESDGAASQNQRVQSELAALRQEMAQLKQNGTGTRGSRAPGAGAAPSAAPAVTGPMAPPPPPAYGGIREVRTPPPEPAAKATERAPAVPEQYYLPSGSMITGVLLTGVDAPTGRSAVRDPVPVLVRVKYEAVLANRFRADVRECFMILEAVGDLASERAMMRSTGVSCIRKDRTVIDVPIQGWAVGEDGRAGMRGRLVTKQGEAIRKAMLAGFADGVSRAFGGNNNISLGRQESVDYGQSAQQGFVGGASTALDRIAQYYLDLADQLHPVVEIDSGRKVTIILLKGRQMVGQEE
jgi:conjugal transfer pilus assembly protein TraB